MEWEKTRKVIEKILIYADLILRCIQAAKKAIKDEYQVWKYEQENPIGD